jgi:flagellar biosynthesis protein FliQ
VNQADILDVAREALLVTLKLGAPVLLLALVAGVAISLLQALT